MPFSRESQVERLFQDYKRSGNHRVQAVTNGKTPSRAEGGGGVGEWFFGMGDRRKNPWLINRGVFFF